MSDFRIDLLIPNKENQEIVSFYLSFNPYSVGDVINVNVNQYERLFHKDTAEHLHDRFEEESQRLRSLLRFKKVKIVSEKKYIDIDVCGHNKLVIEYECEILD